MGLPRGGREGERGHLLLPGLCRSLPEPSCLPSSLFLSLPSSLSLPLPLSYVLCSSLFSSSRLFLSLPSSLVSLALYLLEYRLWLWS